MKKDKKQFQLGTPNNPRVCNVDITMRSNIRFSDSLGINPEQIPEFKVCNHHEDAQEQGKGDARDFSF